MKQPLTKELFQSWIESFIDDYEKEISDKNPESPLLNLVPIKKYLIVYEKLGGGLSYRLGVESRLLVSEFDELTKAINNHLVTGRQLNVIMSPDFYS